MHAQKLRKGEKSKKKNVGNSGTFFYRISACFFLARMNGFQLYKLIKSSASNGYIGLRVGSGFFWALFHSNGIGLKEMLICFVSINGNAEAGSFPLARNGDMWKTEDNVRVQSKVRVYLSRTCARIDFGHRVTQYHMNKWYLVTEILIYFFYSLWIECVS